GVRADDRLADRAAEVDDDDPVSVSVGDLRRDRRRSRHSQQRQGGGDEAHCLDHAASSRSRFSNSRSSERYWLSKRSSGIPGPWNIVNVNALVATPSGTTRVGKRASSSSVGPASMSMTPVSGSASMRKKNSPSPFTTLCRPSTTLSSRANSVAQRGRLAMSARYENTRSFGTGKTAVTVLLVTAPSLLSGGVRASTAVAPAGASRAPRARLRRPAGSAWHER